MHYNAKKHVTLIVTEYLNEVGRYSKITVASSRPDLNPIEHT